MAMSREKQYELAPHYEVFDNLVDPVREQLEVVPPTEESLQLAGYIGARIAHGIHELSHHGEYSVRNLRYMLANEWSEAVEPPRTSLPGQVRAAMVAGAIEGKMAMGFRYIKTELTQEGVVA